MDKNRMINTKFWSDSYISELDPMEKLLYLYLFTNERTSICGAYEITVRIINFDTGIDQAKITEMLKKFEGDEKIIFRENFILLKNFIKHQNLNNGSIRKAIENNLALLPQKIQESMQEVYESCTSGIQEGDKGKERKGKGKEIKRKEEEATSSPNFEKFWEKYPNKIKKSEAEKVWEEKKIDSKTLEKILDFIDRAESTDAWKKKMIPSPRKFLEDERWTDDLSTYADYGSPGGKGKQPLVEVGNHKFYNADEIQTAINNKIIFWDGKKYHLVPEPKSV